MEGPIRAALAAATFLLASSAGADPADWMQFDFDARRSAVNPFETRIGRANVGSIGVLWTASLPETADGAPVFLENVTTSGGAKDLLFVTTKSGEVVALDAATGAIVWSRSPASGPNYTTSSPALDPNRLFVYSYGLDGRVHKLAVGDGAETLTGGWPQIATLKPSVEKGSSALTIATAANGHSYLYVTNGGYPNDAGDYQGHVTTIDLETGAQAVFNAVCSDQTVHFVLGGSPDCPQVQGAIWARAGVTYDARDDRIYMATGNGAFDGNAGGRDWGDSVFSLHADGTGAGGGPLDSYTPLEFQLLQANDADLGSTAPALLPTIASSIHPRLAVQSGKDAKIRLLHLADLSGSGGPGHVGGELQKIDVPQGGEVLTHPAVFTDSSSGDVWVFIANSSGISGLRLAVNGGTPSLVPQWSDTAGGTSPVVANGILWVAASSSLRALDPFTGSVLWSTRAIGGIHWESPIVVDGRIFQSDQSGKLWAFGPPAAHLSLYTVPPCRVLDTRDAGAAVGAGETYILAAAGTCLVPANAVCIVANITVVAGASPGWLRAAPAGSTPLTSNVNFGAGQVRAGFAIVSLTGNPAGSLAVTNGSASAVDVVIDVSGYFK